MITSSQHLITVIHNLIINLLFTEYEIDASSLYERGTPHIQRPPTDYEVPVLTRMTTTSSLLEQYKKIFNSVLISSSRIKFGRDLGEGAYEIAFMTSFNIRLF